MLFITDYRNISLPNELVEEVIKEIEGEFLGYRSHTEFIIDAIRHRLEEVKKLKKK